MTRETSSGQGRRTLTAVKSRSGQGVRRLRCVAGLFFHGDSSGEAEAAEGQGGRVCAHSRRMRCLEGPMFAQGRERRAQQRGSSTTTVRMGSEPYASRYGAGNWTFQQADFRLFCHFMTVRPQGIAGKGRAVASGRSRRGFERGKRSSVELNCRGLRKHSETAGDGCSGLRAARVT